MVYCDRFDVVIPADPDKLEFVRPLIVLDEAEIVLLVRVSVVFLATKVSLVVIAGIVAIPVATADALKVVIPEVEPENAIPGEEKVGVVMYGEVSDLFVKVVTSVSPTIFPEGALFPPNNDAFKNVT